MKQPTAFLAMLGAALSFGMGGNVLKYPPARRYYLPPKQRRFSNQRQERKDARRRFAAGDRFAFA